MTNRTNVNTESNSIYVYCSSSQYGLKLQCVFVPVDLKKIQEVLPRSFSVEYLISLALKLRFK